VKRPAVLSILKEKPHDVPADPGSIWRGIAMAGFTNLCALVGGVLLIRAMIGILVIAGFGALQFLWILPTYFYFDVKQQTETAKGILIAGGITALLSAGCWGCMVALK
jgi:hypothetical protein